MILLLLAPLAQADPIAQRSPAPGDVVVAVGAPEQAVAVRLPAEDDQPRVVLSLGTRVPAGTTELSVGMQHGGGPGSREDTGWAWAAGASVGVFFTRGPSAGLSLAPWARVERRGRVHGGVQVASPIAAGLRGGLRLPVLGELFLGSQRDGIHVQAVGGAGWAFLPSTPAGSLVLQGSVQVGVDLP